VHIEAPVSDILRILLDAAALPEWDPAFSEVRAELPATVGQSIPVQVRGLLEGELLYDRISDHEVATTTQVPGLAEQGTWQLDVTPGGTTVTHAFTQSGWLAELLEPSTRQDARLRVTRLRRRVAQSLSVAR